MFNEIKTFFDLWLFEGNNPGDVLLHLDGDLINLSITTETLTTVLTCVLIGLLLWLAWFVVSWFVKFIIGLCGGVR